MWELDKLAMGLHDQQIRAHQLRLDAYARHMRQSMALVEKWANRQEQQIAKLDRAGHRHGEMEKR